MHGLYIADIYRVQTQHYVPASDSPALFSFSSKQPAPEKSYIVRCYVSVI